LDFIDPKSGESVADWETGELVVTALIRDALPVIRFQTADLTRIISRELQDTPSDSAHHRPDRRQDHCQRGQLLPNANRVDADEPTGRRSNYQIIVE